MESTPATHAKAEGSAGALVFAILVVCAAIGEVSTFLYSPAMPTVGRLFEQPPATVQLTLVSFAVMFATGQLIFGPLSDRTGRRTALLIGAALTLAGSALAAAAGSLWVIMAGRAVQGFGAAAGYCVSRAIVRDIYGADGAPKAMAMLFALMAASFLTASMIGGALLDLAGWRAAFILVTTAAAIWLATTYLIMPETRIAQPQAETQAVHRVYLGLFRHEGFLVFMTTHAISYAGLYCFVAGAPYYLIQSQGLAPAEYGAIAAIAMSGFLVGSTSARSAIPILGMKRVILVALLVMLGAAGGLSGLGLVGFSTAPVIAGMGFVYWFGAGFLAPNTAAGVMMSHPKAAGAAAAVLGFVQMCAAAAVSYAQGLIYDGTVFPMAGMQLALGLCSWLIWIRFNRLTG